MFTVEFRYKMSFSDICRLFLRSHLDYDCRVYKSTVLSLDSVYHDGFCLTSWRLQYYFNLLYMYFQANELPLHFFQLMLKAIFYVMSLIILLPFFFFFRFDCHVRNIFNTTFSNIKIKETYSLHTVLFHSPVNLYM